MVFTELGNFMRSRLGLLPKQSRGMSVMIEASSKVTLLNFSQPLKEPFPNDATPAGSDTLSRASQLLKASLPMVFTPLPMLRVVRLELPELKLLGTSSARNVMVASALHEEITELSMVVTDAGMVSSLRLVQLSKHLYLIVVRLMQSPRLTSVRLLQLWKA